MEYISKNDFAKLFKKLTLPLENFYDEYGLHVGNTSAVYTDHTVPVEGFLRIMWGLTPFFAGKNKGLDNFIKIYNDGFKTGTDKNLPSYWGETEDFDQLYVEMAALSYGLIFAKDKFWDPLDETAKDNLVNWLWQINTHKVVNNNWIMFRVLVNIALKKIGRKYSPEQIEKDFDTVETFYRGDGWYCDGLKGQFDYYIAFAIHFYSLIYVKAMEDEDKERCAIFRKRAEEFAHQFIYWFGENSSAICYGRSLTYRFAQISFWSACLIADVKTFSYGVIKGIISRHLEDWMKYPIFDNAGLLTIGYRYPNLHMCESYNAPGSPYWSFKSFALLMLDDNHPFWSAKPEPLPQLDELRVMKNADMIISRSNGNTYLYTPGLIRPAYFAQTPAKYSKFVYSNKFGFSVSRSAYDLTKEAPDNMLAFVLNGFVFVRYIIDDYKIEDDKIYSKWSPFKGISVETTLIPLGEKHIRHHVITSEYDCEAYDCGFAIEHTDDLVTENYENTAVAKTDNAICTVEGKNGEGHIINAAPNTSLMFSKTVIPSIKYQIKKGKTEIETVVTVK